VIDERLDDRARAAGERVRRDAERIAGTIERFAPPSESGPGRSSHRLLAAAAAAAAAAVVVVVVVAGIGGLLVAANRDAGNDTVSPPPDSRPATTMIAESPTTEPTPPRTTVTVPTTTEPPTVASMRRPIVDPAVCTPISATSGGRLGLPVTLFARTSEFPVPIQIIAGPVDGQAKPFALVQRYVDRERQWFSSENTESINGIDDPAAPRASDVLDADEEPWRQLLIATEPEPELAQLIGGDRELVVDFVPIDDTSTPVSSLTLRVDVTDGVAFLEVYTNDALVADDQTIQTTGTIRLVPAL